MAEDDMGWIESVDPNTGRTFYANRYTRTTQWDPPPGWKSAATAASVAAAAATDGRSSDGHYGANGHSGGTGDDVLSDIARARRQMGGSSATNGAGRQQQQHRRQQQQQHDRQRTTQQRPRHDPNALPDGWEEMTDASTGRKFYVDHARKITTWERPTSSGGDDFHANNGSSGGSGGRATVDGADHATKLNQHGSHARWDDDPRSGSRSSRGGHINDDDDDDDGGYRRQHSYSMGLEHGASSHAGPPPLDFVAVSVPDALRNECPGCGTAFTYIQRRHHCRLCGDVFCDACSSSRAILPLDGPEFDTPVRCCDWCMKDVKKGNYFSLRRYLTPLQLFDPNDHREHHRLAKDDLDAGSGEATREITADAVAASLSSLSADVDAMMKNDPTSLEGKITVPARVLVSAVGGHLRLRSTAEYAVRVLAGLLAMGNVAGDDSFASATCSSGEKKVAAGSSFEEEKEDGPGPSRDAMCGGEILGDVLGILEWNGNDGRTLSAMEQAAKVIYYVTDPDFVAAEISKWDDNARGRSEESSDGSAGGGADASRTSNDGPIDVDAMAESMHDIMKLDVHRAFRSMLDHATNSASLSLQRWAVATLRHLITEDRRRACVYHDSGPAEYRSFTTQLVSGGGIMILCSLLSSEDAETRAHATSALEAIVVATRQIGAVLDDGRQGGSSKFKSRVGRGTEGDSAVVDAVVAGGGCGAALAHLLISSEESVAEMGCGFASSLTSPLLTDPRGSGKALRTCVVGGGSSAGARDDGLGSYRRAALALVVGEEGSGGRGEASCLPSLIQIVRSGTEDSSWGHNGGRARSLKLQVVAGECLAAISLAVGHIVGARTLSDDDEGGLRRRATRALEIMEREGMHDVAFGTVASASSRSLDPGRNTPRARLREAAGLTLLALSSCSAEAASYLMSNKAVSKLLGIASESLAAPSALRGEWASRGLCYLETAAMLLLRAWKGDDPSCLNLLLDALDAGAVGLASKLVTSRVHLKHHDRAYSQMRIKIAISYMLSAMFGIAGAEDDEDNPLGASRLYGAIDADCAAALAYGNDNEASAPNGRTDLVASTVYLLSATLPYAQRFANEDPVEPLPMMDLSEACILAVGGMCGAAEPGGFVARGGDDASATEAARDEFGEARAGGKHSHLRTDAARMACKTLTDARKGGGALLPSVLIGALGESLVVPALRLTLAMARNGDHEVRGDLARSGMLVPVGDIMQQSLSSGERHTFSMAIAIIKFCGPSLIVDRANMGSIASLQNCIQTLSCVLVMPESGGEDATRRKALSALKHEALRTLEALSSNEALHGSLFDVFPSLAEFLIQLDGSADADTDDMVCSALKTIRSIISLPSSSPSSSAAVDGMISSFVRIMNSSHGTEKAGNNRKREVSLELLHAIALGKSDSTAGNGKGRSLLASGVLESIVSLLGEGDGVSAKMIHLGLEILEFVIADIEQFIFTNSSTHSDNPILRRFVDDVTGQEKFLRALCATMMAKSNRKIDIPPLFGAPLVPPLDPAEDKAINMLFRMASLLCSDVSGVGKEHFLHAFMLKDLRGAAKTVSMASCTFLDLLMDEANGICVPPINPTDRSLFINVKLPMIRSVLLRGLSSSLDECFASSDNDSRKHAEILIREFRLPQLCLQYCQSKQLFSAAFELYENVVLQLPMDMLGDLLLADKSSLVALFDLVTGRNSSPAHDGFDEHSKQTFALTLGNLAKAGALSAAVERFGVRNNAIAALSAAMQGESEENIIDESEDSLPRICVESLVVILRDKNQREELEITALEARIMATAIGKILSSTVLNRFFTQASLESTFDVSMNHSSDRSAISQSPEAQLLCSIATFPDTLEMLQKVGGLEAVGLIAHEGELVAIRAIRKACESSPKSVVDVDAHLSIMDALIQVEGKLSTSTTNDVLDVEKLQEVAAKCIQIIAILTQNKETKSAVISADQSFGCLMASACIISARSTLLCQKSEPVKDDGPSAEKQCVVPTIDESTDSTEVDVAILHGNGHTSMTENLSDDLQLGDSVLVDSTTASSNQLSSPLKSGPTPVLEGVVAHLGAVKFAPGDDWIGIRLTGPSVGLGRNNGSVKDVRYFDCSNKSGVFTKRNNVKRQEREEVLESEEKKETAVEELDSVKEEKNTSLVETQQENLWTRLLSNSNHFILESDAFSLLQSFSSSKPHRDLLMATSTVINGMISVIQLQSPDLATLQCNALDLLVTFTLHLQNQDVELTKLLCSVVESRTRVLQISRDKRLLHSTKEMLTLAISGLENIFCCFMDADEKLRSMKIASDLFVFLADSFYKGPKSRRLSASKTDGLLFYRLSSLFTFSLGLESLRASILTVRFISSSTRFVMMTAGLTSHDFHIPITESVGGEYWNAALSHCLYWLSCNMTQLSQDHIGTSYFSLIAEVEASPESFRSCLDHIAEKKPGGALSVSARQILAKLELISS